MILSGSSSTYEQRAPALRWVHILQMLEHSAQHVPQKGVYLIGPDGTKEFRSWPQILEESKRVTAAVKRAHLDPGERVVIMMHTQFSFLYAFFGCIGAGVVPVPLAAPRDNHPEPLIHLQTLGRFARRLDASTILYDHSLPLDLRPNAGPAQPFSLATDLLSFVENIPLGVEVDFGGTKSEIAYVQPTAGAMGHVRAVALSHHNILTNIRAVSEALCMQPQDVGVSWLPLDNVMSLVGFVLMSVYWGLDTVLMDPTLFLSHPHEWLRAIDDHKATITSAPDFAYYYCTRRARNSDLEGLDLSSLRVAMSGGESVRAQHLQSFYKRFSEYGLKNDAFLPVYGLSEGTLGVTFCKLGEHFAVDGINRKVLEEQGVAEPLGPEGAPKPDQRMHLVSVGAPLADVDLCIMTKHGEMLGERELGEVAFRGPNVMYGYVDRPNPDTAQRATTRHKEWLLTGDLGYIAQGKLYLVDRLYDSPVLDGRRFFPGEVELFVNSVDGVRAGSSVAFVAQPGDRVVVAYETQMGADREEIDLEVRRLLKRHLNLVPDNVMALAPFSVPKTRHGKVRRHHARRFYEMEQLDRSQRGHELEGVRRLANRARGDLLRFSEKVRLKVDRWMSLRKK